MGVYHIFMRSAQRDAGARRTQVKKLIQMDVYHISMRSVQHGAGARRTQVKKSLI